MNAFFFWMGGGGWLDDVIFIFIWIDFPRRGWASLGGTAIPSQPAAEALQAGHIRQVPKISLIFWDPFGSVSDIKLIRTDTTLWS